ncbi:PQQ-dependent sugar dehydrogenase [Ramlibacter monticola]|uniref:PQQ-dependent sugar dehydrogenase n=2 Tax=Ramlibacter monticola TaxID=1926872 RepID=A0A936YXU1_9BURK|nr:PQQ-dependent sugar dehydrogenase [Ramlibacter monticola]
MKLAAGFLTAMLAACGGGGGGGGGGGDAGPAPSPAPPPAPDPQAPRSFALVTEVAASGLAEPVFATAPEGDARLFVVERAGRIVIVQGGARSARPFLDIAARVGTTGEGGLLSMAFDPRYAVNGFFYLYFTEASGDIAIERFRVSAADPDVADPAPLRILTIPHRTFSNHKGGLVRFGPDGFLYLGTGDGGGGGDPSRNGQNLDSLLGKLLRIDVRNATAAAPYAIPSGNPFTGQPNRRAEIWAYGLRNPWRYAFDAPTGRLYIGDVGQARLEEVDVSPADSPGLDYGWNVTEGTECFAPDSCDKAGITLPVLEYGHDADGGCSVIGGFVYRGSAFPELEGRYFYSDLCGGWLRSFVFSGSTASDPRQFIASMGTVLSFGEDGQKELYVLTGAGEVLRIQRVFQ